MTDRSDGFPEEPTNIHLPGRAQAWCGMLLRTEFDEPPKGPCRVLEAGTLFNPVRKLFVINKDELDDKQILDLGDPRIIRLEIARFLAVEDARGVQCTLMIDARGIQAMGMRGEPSGIIIEEAGVSFQHPLEATQQLQAIGKDLDETIHLPDKTINVGRAAVHLIRPLDKAKILVQQALEHRKAP